MVPLAPTPCPKAMLPATTARKPKRQIPLNDIRPPPKVAYCCRGEWLCPHLPAFKWCRYTKAGRRAPRTLRQHKNAHSEYAPENTEGKTRMSREKKFLNRIYGTNRATTSNWVRLGGLTGQNRRITGFSDGQESMSQGLKPTRASHLRRG